MQLNILHRIGQYYASHPLRTIVIIALAVRLIAVFFAKGYMMHDDHFLTVEPSASWAAGKNFNDWLPGIGNEREHPEPISFFYLGFLYVFFRVMHWLGIENPDMQMYLMRALHALYSLLTIYFAWKITLKIDSLKSARSVAWLLAIIAIMPNFSVRNLVEFVCQPPLLAAFWLLICSGVFEKNFRAIAWKKLILGSLIMGLAVGFRYQLVLVSFGVGLVILYYRHFMQAVTFGVVAFAGFFITQIDDVILWGGQPFQHLFGYFEYNKTHALNYPGSPWAYLSFIGIFILPPVSLMLLAGFVKSWRRLLYIVLPAAVFILFHLFYPNKQERFLLPVLPLFVIAGVIGWYRFQLQSAFWMKRARLMSTMIGIFLFVNLSAMMVLCFTYAKSSRVEAMLYLYNRGDCDNFIREYSHADGAAMPPQFYAANWSSYYEFGSRVDPHGIVKHMDKIEEENRGSVHERPLPDYLLFYDDTRIEERLTKMKGFFQLEYCTTVEPGWFDRLLHKLNDKNTLERVHIYKIHHTPRTFLP